MSNEITQGEVLTLANGKEYLVFLVAPNSRGNKYIYLTTQSETPEILFLEQLTVNGVLTVQELQTQADKLDALQILQSMV